MSNNEHYDVIVIGGGASGMMAAGRAASLGKRVLLVEKNKVLGKKLSITGGGRCNILNAEKDQRELISYYGDAAKFLHSPFSQHGMQDSWDFFHELDLPLVVEARKRAFPESQSAPDVTLAMRTYCTDHNVELKVKTSILGFNEKDGRIESIETSNGVFTADSYILATGGAAHKDTSASAEAVSWLGALGHTVHTPSPNIVPLKAKEEWVHRLSGTTLTFMKITFGRGAKKSQSFSRVGKILFTHFGLSGPLILNSSKQVAELLKNGEVPTTIDMYPDTEIGTLRNRVLEHFEINKNKDLKNILPDLVPAGMTQAVMAQFPDMKDIKVNSITKEQRHALVDIMKAMPLKINGTMGLDWAVISDGGVDLTEVDMKTMRSKKIDNLFLIGDTLHVNRPSGGYSLQLCWTTGWVAGSHA